MIAREGYPTIGIVALLTVMVIWLTSDLSIVPRIVVGILALDVFTMIVFFFRDPVRTLPDGVDGQSVLISPADGKVVGIIDLKDHDYVGASPRQLSIFLSPLDVHVNRVPAAGVIERLDYFPGSKSVAWAPKASELNERAEFGLKHASGAKILFRQITGVLARRIVYHIRRGEAVTAGQRFGIMKFGSRMDIVVPSGFEFRVAEGDRVIGGISVLGHFGQDY